MKSRNESMVVLGLMSGSSLDGVDVGIFRFSEKKENSAPEVKWLYTQTHPYSKDLREKLKQADQLTLEAYFELEAELSRYYGQLIRKTFTDSQEVDLAAIHGHTVFHQPEKGFSIQMGLGGIIAEKAGVPIVTDFRNNPIGHGWQGAPMVPILDRLYSQDIDFFLNLGGIANLSIFRNGDVISMDVCGCNQLLNGLASELGVEFDKDGHIATGGMLNQSLLDELDKLPFLHQSAPKSLSNQQVKSFYIPILKTHQLPLEDKMRTVVEHIATAIFRELEPFSDGHLRKIMVSGGGAHHLKLMSVLKSRLNPLNIELEIPDKMFIDFKESLLMAYSGWLRWKNRANFIPEPGQTYLKVTGGGVYLPANYF